MKKNQTIKCPSCNGKGERPLDAVYVETLAQFSRHPELTSIGLSNLLDIEQSAAMMRLSRLTAWGLLKRSGTRREYTYSKSK